MNQELFAAAFTRAREGVDAFARMSAPIFRRLGFKWSLPGGPDYIPDEDAIRLRTHDLLDSLESYGKSPSRTGCGRIWVSVGHNEADDDLYAVHIMLAAAEVNGYSNGMLWVSDKRFTNGDCLATK